MSKTREMSYLGIGIALYVVLGMMIKIPLIGHIQTDFGYVAYGTFLSLFGLPAIIVGVAGCIIESLVFSGWIPIGWAVGQLVIGLMCGLAFKWIADISNPFIKYLLYVITVLVSVFIGIAFIKTVIECNLYAIPFQIKYVKNFIAAIADMPPIFIGVVVAEIIKKRVRKAGK